MGFEDRPAAETQGTIRLLCSLLVSFLWEVEGCSGDPAAFPGMALLSAVLQSLAGKPCSNQIYIRAQLESYKVTTLANRNIDSPDCEI